MILYNLLVFPMILILVMFETGIGQLAAPLDEDNYYLHLFFRVTSPMFDYSFLYHLSVLHERKSMWIKIQGVIFSLPENR